MANKTKQTNKLVPLSEERYIKERARNLKIVKCLISQDLKETGLVASLVIRQMANGNYVIGSYIIDKYCLGVKDTAYIHNGDNNRLVELVRQLSIEYGKLVETPYVQVHNLIYGGIDYAEKLGLKPHKNWGVSQYILNEDTDEIELIKYKYGKNGKPLYHANPQDKAYQMIINTLKKSVGEGNFDVEFVKKNPYDDVILANNLMNEANRMGFKNNQTEWFNHDLSFSPRYDPIMDTIESKDIASLEKIQQTLQITPLENIPKLEYLIKKYPNFPRAYNFIINSYFYLNKQKESDEWLELSLTKFPDEFYMKGTVAAKYLNAFQPDKMLRKAFSGAISLKELYPNRNVFHSDEFSEFYAIMMLYYLDKAKTDVAILLLNFLEEIVPNEPKTQEAREIYEKHPVHLLSFKTVAKTLFNKIFSK